MKPLNHLRLLIVTGIFAGTTATAQSLYLYQKGKSFKDVSAYPMEQKIKPENAAASILYERQLPAGHHTLAYRVVLPAYTGGIFFSRDSRPGDFEWPNNTNRLLPGKSAEKIETFYEYYIRTMKQNGFDFLKIDNQAFTLPLYMGGTQAVSQAKACNLALERQTHRQQIQLMNCMAQNVVNTDHTVYSAVTRVSIDYKKYDENMAKSHLFQSYTNTLLLGQTVWPDHDMFHSSDSICGSLMARSKAISGGPVYLSDSPVDFVRENILPLIDERGKIPLACYGRDAGTYRPDTGLERPLSRHSARMGGERRETGTAEHHREENRKN